jgi:ATP-dependent RNA helicase DeaD
MKITELNLQPTIEKALKKMGYEDLTAIQEMTLEPLLNGSDVIAEAPTGTGKTAAYSIPMLSQINPNVPKVQALIICPTRELAIQVIQEICKFSTFMPSIHYVAIYGGQKVATQLRGLKNNPQIIVGTPGRLNDLITRKYINLNQVSYLVLDECDEMLEMGFIKDVNKIIEKVTALHQTALFSATISDDIKKIAKKYLKEDAKHFTIKRTPSQDNQIAQKYVYVNENEKKEDIVNLLAGLSFRRAFVFCRTKHKVMQIEKILKKNTTNSVVSLQGNLSQNKRDRAMKAFRDYDANIMVATDIAARGIDVSDVDLVINYDVPEEDEFYLHRIGRTGRVDKTGTAYTFLNKSEHKLVKKYEAMTHCKLEEYKINKGAAMKKYLENLEPTLKEDLSEEKKAIQEVCDALAVKEGHPIDPLDLAAALLKEKMNEPDSEVAKERDYSSSHNASIERNKEKKRFVTDPNNQRFFINVGFEDGANEDNLKSFIMKNVKGLELDDFADVFLKGTFSFFETPKDSTDNIIHYLEGSTFEGKLVHIEKTERPEDGERKPSRSRGDFHHGPRRGGYGHDSHSHHGGSSRSSHSSYSRSKYNHK